MAASLLQSATAASSAAGPTSVTPTLGAPSTAGNLLVLVVVVTGTSPTITGPAGWTQITATSAAGIIMRLLMLQNNAGGITAVAVTVGGTGGGAAAAIFEFSGVGNTALDNSGANQSAGSTSYISPTGLPAATIGELLFYSTGFAAANLTPTNSNEWSPVVGAVVSTNGTPNAQLASFWGVSPDGHKPTQSGTFDASVAHCTVLAIFIIAGTQQTNQTPIGGVSGQYVGQFNQGMTGG